MYSTTNYLSNKKNIVSKICRYLLKLEIPKYTTIWVVTIIYHTNNYRRAWPPLQTLEGPMTPLAPFPTPLDDMKWSPREILMLVAIVQF